MIHQCNLANMFWTVSKMLLWRGMFVTVISKFFSSKGPVESELYLDHVAVQPVESHVHGLGAIGENGVVGDSHVGGIIGLDG